GSGEAKKKDKGQRGEAKKKKAGPLKNQKSRRSERPANSGDSLWFAAGGIIWILALLWRIGVFGICRASASLGYRAAAHVRNGTLFVAGVYHGQRTHDHPLGRWECVEFLPQSHA